MITYLDNASTTKLLPEINLNNLCNEFYANPSSIHDLGFSVEQKIKDVSKTIASAINCSYDEIIYTSCGTESNNLAIFGSSENNRNKHIITSVFEHSSVIQCYKKLEEKGYKTTYLEMKEDKLDLELLKDSITEETYLVSIVHINSELGIINDIEKIGQIIKQKNPRTLFHVDAVQSFCKINIDVRKCFIDLLSISGHKHHALKGVGVLYVKKGLKILPRILGGGQQNNFRSGTQNTLGILTMGAAMDILIPNISENYIRVLDLNRYLKSKLARLKNVIIYNNESLSPFIVNASFLDIKPETLVHILSQKNIYISTGSSCSSNKKIKNNLIKIGIDKKIANFSVRISLSIFTTNLEIDCLIEEITNALK